MKKLFNLVGNLGEIAQKPRAENLKTAVYFSETFGLFIPNSTQNWTVFNCYLLNKHPPISLHVILFLRYAIYQFLQCNSIGTAALIC